MKNPPIKTLKRKLDKIFSQYIRMRDSDAHTGMGFCVTCKKSLHYKKGHAGHFIRRGHNEVRYDERNVHLQCPYCNTFLDGNEAEYFVALEKKLGRETVDELMEKKWNTKRWTKGELKELIEKYQERIKILESK